MALSPEQELTRAKEEYETVKAQAKARYDKVKARHTAAARKLDTRRKIIVGGALIDMASRDEKVAGFLKRLIDKLPRDQDKKVFEEWDALPGSDGDNSASSETRNDGQGASSSVDSTMSDSEGSENGNRSSSDSSSASSDTKKVPSYYEQQAANRT